MYYTFLLQTQNTFPGVGVPGSEFVTFLWLVYKLPIALQEDGAKCLFWGEMF